MKIGVGKEIKGDKRKVTLISELIAILAGSGHHIWMENKGLLKIICSGLGRVRANSPLSLD